MGRCFFFEAYGLSRQDVLELKWTENPAWGKVEGAARFSCPVTGVEANGRHGGFVALRGCGCVFSERALREVPTDECLQCRRPFVRERDVLPLNPSPQVAEQLLAEWKLRAKDHRKKSKKSSKRRAAGTNDGATAAEQRQPADESQANGKRKHAVADDGEKKARKEMKKKYKTDLKNGAPAAKKARTTAQTADENKPAIVSKMSKDVYSSIFLPNGQRTKPATFTHYG